MNWGKSGQTVRDLIDWAADKNPNRIFLISPETGFSLTFKQLQQSALRLCKRFDDIGLEHGDKIAFLMDNGLFTIQLFLGAMYGGFVSVPLNVRAGQSHLSYMADHCDAKVVFVDDHYKSLIEQATLGLSRPLEIIIADTDTFVDESHRPSSRNRLTPVSADDAALLMYSSGTTGQPNGAIHTHKSLLAHGRNAAQSHQLTPADRSLLVLPIYHINAECVTLLPTLTSGGSVVVPRSFAVNEFWDLLANYGCTWSALVPTIISQLLDWKDPKLESRTSAFQRIRFLRTSSGPLSPSLHREFLDKFKLLLIQAMGCSEGGNVFSNPLPPKKNKIGSPGFPWGFDAKIVDREGTDVPEGEPGEVLLRGDGLMRGYYKDPAGSAAAFDGEGWFHTGDLAYRDQDGYFFVVGRSKELVIKGGMNIAPKQIDEVLESHPAVLEAAALGVPDRYLGEDLVAFAVLRDGMTCSEGELLSFCDERLGHFKTPTRIHFASELPKGPSGKVQRLRLVQEAQRLTTEDSILRTPDRLVRETPIHLDASLEDAIGDIWSELLKQPGIDPTSNFFALGGQSLLAIQYISRLREKMRVILSLSDFFENPTVKQQAELVRKRLAKSFGAVDDVQSSTEPEIVSPRDRTLPCRLSPSQDRLWFLEQLIAGEPVYNESEAVRLKGGLNIEALERALNCVIERHEVLRSTIEVRSGEPQVVVHDDWPVRINGIDLTELPVDQREAELSRLLVEEPRRRYRLDAAPGIRFTVITLTTEEHACILMMHHIICDSTSLGILWREIASAYQCFLNGQSPSLPALPIQYWDYAAWQRLPSRGAGVEADLSFWREKLRDAPEVLDLPMERPRPPVNFYRGEKRLFSLDGELAAKLRGLSRQEQSSLFTVFAAALSALFCRYTGKDDILLGIPIADRDRSESRSLIGFMIDTQVLRTDLSGKPTFRELLARVQRGVAELYSHRSVPFDRVVDAVRPQRSLSYSPLIQVMLNWRDRDEQPQFIGFPGLAVEPLLSHSGTSKFDLTMVVTDAADSILLEIEYSTDLFDGSCVDAVVEHLRQILEAASVNSDQRITQLPLLTNVERRRLLVERNNTQRDYPDTKCVHELFEEQVERTPDATAVVFAGKLLTYRRLNRWADEVAARLRTLGVAPGALVALFLERSLEMVVGMLAALKAGAAYVPLDPTHPHKRLAFMLEDAKPLVLLTQQNLHSKLPAYRCPIVIIDAGAVPAKRLALCPPANRSPTPRDLAYVIYTSGSTGEPKGVEIEHRAVVNMLSSLQRQPGLGISDTMLAITTVTFDIAVLEIFLPLISGARVVIAGSRDLGDADALIGLMERYGVTAIQATPATMRMLLQGGWHGTPGLKVLCGGEAWGADLAKDLLARCGSLWNMYGPTETTVWSAAGRVESGAPVVIGPPIANTQLYVLDHDLQPLPMGVPGELHIGGIGLARGYHNRAELTAEKFIADPFRSEPEARLYKTGDLARYAPRGTIEYLGRMDFQVKVRGFRIELGEIESVLTELPEVREAVVVVREDVPDDKRLVAYLTAHGGKKLNASELRGRLQPKLPDYMTPSAFVMLERLPITPSGKLDRKALPAPEQSVETEQGYVAPITHLEQVLSSIWCRSLNLQRVGMQDNFFELGGYSLLVVHVVGEINKALNSRLNVPTFFRNPTIAQLTRVLAQNDDAGSDQRVMQLQFGLKGLPLYLIGAGLAEHRIAHVIGEDRAIFAVDIRIPSEWRRPIEVGDRAALPTMDHLATSYAKVLREHAGSSPCVVVGCNFAGKLAFEAARALQSAGGNVAFVLLIDAHTWSGGLLRGPAWQSWLQIWQALTDGAKGTPFVHRLGTFLRDSWRLLRWMFDRMPDVMKSRLATSTFEAPSNFLDTQGIPLEGALMKRLSRIVGESFHPRPLDAPGVLMRAKFSGEDLLPGHDFKSGWGELFTQGLEVVQARGEHVAMVADENAPSLRRQINAVLDERDWDDERRIAVQH